MLSANASLTGLPNWRTDSKISNYHRSPSFAGYQETGGIGSRITELGQRDHQSAFLHTFGRIRLPSTNDLKRAFYEIECLRGNWSVRELKRQIASLYFERSGLSRDKRKLARLIRADAEQAEPKLAIRDPYVFEFLGLRSRETMSESDLEDALLDKLQDFLLELGQRFLFRSAAKARPDRQHARIRRFGFLSPGSEMPRAGRTQDRRVQPREPRPANIYVNLRRNI